MAFAMFYNLAGTTVLENLRRKSHQLLISQPNFYRGIWRNKERRLHGRIMSPRKKNQEIEKNVKILISVFCDCQDCITFIKKENWNTQPNERQAF